MPCLHPCNKVIRGAVGVLKAIVGIDRAPANVIAARLKACRGCDRATKARDGVRVVKCRECDCFIKLKIKLAGEKCPRNRWNNVEAETDE